MRILALFIAAGCGGGEKGGPGAGGGSGTVDADGDGSPEGEDCDDADPDVHPGAEETCDGVNNDCDGGVDENDATDAVTWYRDGDGDGYPTAGSSITACERPPGYLSGGGDWDCDDASAAAHPGALEVCGDGVDNDCDGDLTECRRAGAESLALADAVLAGATSGDRAGWAVAGFGDVDGDGFGDLGVGAPYRDSAGSDAGSVFLVAGPVTGSASLSASRAELVAASSGHHAGWALAGVGDADGDGFSDVLVGAPGANGGGNDSGEAYLLFGPLSGEVQLSVAGGKLVGELAYDVAGISVSGGDLDGDGRPDLVAGATGLGDGSFQNRGGAYVVAGPVTGATDLSAATARILGEQRYDRLGTSVSAVGDVDGDGLGDLLVGASTWPANDGQGAAFLFSGPVSGALDATGASAVLAGEDAGHQAGVALGGGDVDGDGRADVIVGASLATVSLDEQGAAYVVLGPVTGEVGLGTAEARLLGPAERDEAGAAVAGGDFDADGLSDVAVGAPASDADATDGGAVFLVYGPVSGTLDLSGAALVLSGAAARDAAGAAAAFSGDATGDGIGDLLVGATDADAAGADAGAVYVVAGWGG